MKKQPQTRTSSATLNILNSGLGARPRYTLHDLLAQCSPKVPRKKTEEEQQWLSDMAVGDEVI